MHWYSMAEQRNILMSQIESAKQAQKDRHHYELLSFQNDKLRAEQSLGLQKLDDEMKRHQDNLQMQIQQMDNQLKIAEMNNDTTLTNAMFSHFAVMGQQNNQAMWTILYKILDNIMQENAHKRQLKAMRFSSELELIKMEMIQAHEKAVIALNHNLLLVKIRLESDLKREELDFEKYCIVFYKLLEKVLELSEQKQELDKAKIDEYVNNFRRQMPDPFTQ